MAETKLEKFIETWRRRLCDWGLIRPTQPTDNKVYLGGSAPLWENPAPKYLQWIGVLSCLIALVTIMLVLLILLELDDCPDMPLKTMSTVWGVWMFVNSLLIFRIANTEIATDTQWSRYLTFMVVSEFILIGIFLVLFIGTLGFYSGMVDDTCHADHYVVWE